MSAQLILASRSPARATLLQRAQIPFRAVVSDVDEDAVLASHGPHGCLDPAETALLLARAKAEAVAGLPEAQGHLVIGCDSVFELDGEVYGKPHFPDVARERISSMQGRSGVLHTGHWLVDARGSQTSSAAETMDTFAQVLPGAGAMAQATVHFAPMTDQEISDYVATGEPLEVAGSFTLDGMGSLFIERVDGDTNAVIGLSLNTLRLLLAQRDVTLSSWWHVSPQP